VIVLEVDEKVIFGEVWWLLVYFEVCESFTCLCDVGFCFVVFMNLIGFVEEVQFFNVGIRDLFDQVLMADDVKCLKSVLEVYVVVVSKFGVFFGCVWLIVVHVWDVVGVMCVGCAVVFVVRLGVLWNFLLEKFDIWGKDLCEVVDQIIACDC